MIKVDVIEGGDLAANALIYKQPTAAIQEYLYNSMANVISRVGQYATQFVDNAKMLYNKYHNNDVAEATKLILNQSGTYFSEWGIYTVPYEHFHLATLGMQQYIMLHPEVFKLNSKNMCYGYANTYIDPEPNTDLEDRYMYQNVMDGLLRFEKNGEGYIKYYSNSQEELDILDRISVLDTWDNVSLMLAEGLDPTDPDYEEL